MKRNGVYKTRLKNGLTVLLKEVHTAPVATWWVWYKVGSRFEPTGQTGISHWVEHMMFKGTRRFPADVLDTAVSREGGLWNAFTWIDWTAYFETMPADRIDLGLRLEADRMTKALFPPKQVEPERTVIISERHGSENDPSFLLSEQIHAAAFRVHPYHHMVIGDETDLETLTREDLYRHYRNFYAPNNAIAVGVGDFKTGAMLARIKELYGGLPAGPAPKRLIRPEPLQKGERRIVVEGEGQSVYVEIAYHAPSATDPDFYPMVALDSILAGASSFNLFGGGTTNKSSRLYKSLVETELATSVSGSLSATADPYLYSLNATVRAGRTPEAVEKALDVEIDRAAVTQAELGKALKQAKAMFAYSSESVSNLGFWLGYTETFDTHAWFEHYLDRLNAVTVEDVQRVAGKVLARRNRTVGWYVPKS